jgi:hypothetical protein
MYRCGSLEFVGVVVVAVAGLEAGDGTAFSLFKGLGCRS